MSVTETIPTPDRIEVEERVRIPLDAPKRRRDAATWIGLATALLLLVVAALIGGTLPAYVDLPAALMVLGGTAAVTVVSFPLEDARRLPKVVLTTLFHGLPKPGDTARRLIELAERARVRGPLALENDLIRLSDDRFLVKAIALVIDNTPPETIERELRTDLQATLLRHRIAADMLRRGGEVAPAMGLIGTLVGLVQMLSNLNTPSSIGPSMAVAILATLYGAVLANVVLLPLAGKLDRNNQSESLIANLAIMAAVSMAAHDSPRRLEVMLNGILPPADRIACFD